MFVLGIKLSSFNFEKSSFFCCSPRSDRGGNNLKKFLFLSDKKV